MSSPAHSLFSRPGDHSAKTASRRAEVEIPRPRTEAPARPRVWLVAGLGPARHSPAEPADRPAVRDDLMRTWRHGIDGRWHTPDGRHHATWTELHARFDLIEVTP
jgi:hypothetical protein